MSIQTRTIKIPHIAIKHKTNITYWRYECKTYGWVKNDWKLIEINWVDGEEIVDDPMDIIKEIEDPWYKIII